MRQVVAQEWFKPLMLALMIVGGGLLAFGAFQFFSTSSQIGQNLAYQIQSRNEQIDPQSMSEAQGLVAADIELRRLQSEQNTALMLGGGGLILIALGWLGRDAAGTSQRRAGTPTSG